MVLNKLKKSGKATIEFYFPKSCNDLIYSTYNGFFELIFQTFSCFDLVNLIKCLLLEKTIIFVGPEQMTSCFIMGLN
jgi:hypothetical protein